MPTESDRDDLARIIFTATHQFRHQTWEHTSVGWRNWCREKADEAMAAGWRKVGADQVVISHQTADDIMQLTAYLCAAEAFRERVLDGRELMELITEIRFAMKRAWESAADAALADPAGANGGE